MSMRMRNKRSADFSMSSLTDIIFLLLIFFLLTSTLVQPNAVKLLLPNSTSQTQARQNVAVAIDAQNQFYFNNEPVALEQLASLLLQGVAGQPDPTVVLYADKTVAIEQVVKVMSIASDQKIKMILATEPQR
ncbi:MAG: biopolymer transporter ExbD [Bacteroidetes bacterium]|nr:biopolymer transporter ExbD [Bacteroidota bacterium]